MRRISIYKVATTILLSLAVGVASAGDADDQKAAKAQRMLRQMALERDTLQTENAKLKGELDALNRKLGDVKKSSEAALGKSRGNYTSLNENFQTTTQNLLKVEADKNQLQETLGEQAQLLVSCEDNNAKMVQINRELLARYEKKGALDVMLQREPLTQLKRVEIENIAQEYQDKIDQLEFKKKLADAATR